MAGEVVGCVVALLLGGSRRRSKGFTGVGRCRRCVGLHSSIGLGVGLRLYNERVLVRARQQMTTTEIDGMEDDDDNNKVKDWECDQKGSLPCLGGEDLLDVFGDFDVAREPSVEAMMSINSFAGALRCPGAVVGRAVVLNSGKSDGRGNGWKS